MQYTLKSFLKNYERTLSKILLIEREVSHLAQNLRLTNARFETEKAFLWNSMEQEFKRN